ncbi:MAG: hypothetical protein SFV18_00795 [Bryobacteraceae bacterium]|nr:hypothetical protein [Bryobacteraceae bacterium]
MTMERPMKSTKPASLKGSAQLAEEQIDLALAAIYKQYGSNLAQFWADVLAKRERERQLADESDRASSAQQQLDFPPQP